MAAGKCKECGHVYNIAYHDECTKCGCPDIVIPKQDDMEERHPGYRKENYDVGRFLDLDFPYVAGDPDF